MDDLVQGAAILADPKRETEVAPIHKIGIIGAGQMGGGIAHVIALSGYDVVMHDVAKERVDAALAIIDKNLARQVASGKITEWPSPGGPYSLPYAMTYLKGAIWYSEAGTRPNTLVRFDLATEQFQTWYIPSGGGVVRNRYHCCTIPTALLVSIYNARPLGERANMPPNIKGINAIIFACAGSIPGVEW